MPPVAPQMGPPAIPPTTTTTTPAVTPEAPFPDGLPDIQRTLDLADRGVPPQNPLVSYLDWNTNPDIRTITTDQIASFTFQDMLLIKERITEFSPDQLAWFPPELMRSLTPDQFRVLTPQQIHALTPEQVQNIPAQYFTYLNREQLNSFAEGIFQPLLDWNTNPDIRTITTDQIASFNFQDMRSIKQRIAEFSPDQLAWIPPQLMGSLTPDQFRVLTPQQIHALTPEQVQNIPVEYFAYLNRAQLSSFSDPTYQSLSAEQLAIIDRAMLEPLRDQQIRSIASDNASTITAGDFERIAPQQMQYLPTYVIDKISPDVWRSVSPAHLAQLLPQQIAAMTPQQIAALTPEQVAVLSPEALRAINPAAASPALRAEHYRAQRTVSASRGTPEIDLKGNDPQNPAVQAMAVSLTAWQQLNAQIDLIYRAHGNQRNFDLYPDQVKAELGPLLRQRLQFEEDLIAAVDAGGAGYELTWKPFVEDDSRRIYFREGAIPRLPAQVAPPAQPAVDPAQQIPAVDPAGPPQTFADPQSFQPMPATQDWNGPNPTFAPPDSAYPDMQEWNKGSQYQWAPPTGYSPHEQHLVGQYYIQQHTDPYQNFQVVGTPTMPSQQAIAQQAYESLDTMRFYRQRLEGMDRQFPGLVPEATRRYGWAAIQFMDTVVRGIDQGLRFRI